MSRHPNAVLMPRGQETFVYRGTSNRAAGAALEYPPPSWSGGFARSGFGRAPHPVFGACEHGAPVIRADVILPHRRGGYSGLLSAFPLLRGQ